MDMKILIMAMEITITKLVTTAKMTMVKMQKDSELFKFCRLPNFYSLLKLLL